MGEIGAAFLAGSGGGSGEIFQQIVGDGDGFDGLANVGGVTLAEDGGHVLQPVVGFGEVGIFLQ